MMREIRIRPLATDEEYQTKLDHATRFLGNGDQLKITVMFRGREVGHPEKGERILLEFVKDLEKYAKAELPIVFDRTQVSLMFTPKIVG
jgi:translation initiation factor IF-3